MSRHPPHDNATSNVLAWSPTAANVESALEEEAGADADEPPDMRLANYKMSPDFRRKTAVSRPKENHASLLTRALQSASEGETTSVTNIQSSYRRRRSITSDISVASTADLTSDTGLSTPARTNSPSPRLRSIGFVPLSLDKDTGAPVQILGSLPKKTISAYPLSHNRSSPRPTTPTKAAKDSAVQTIEKKRCISFACTAKPKEGVAKAPTPVAAAPAPTQAPQPTQPRKPCIRFACTAKPSRPAPETPPQSEGLGISRNTDESGSVSTVVSASSTIRKARSPTPRRARPMTPKRFPPSPAPIRKKKYLTASSDELQGEVCHFHEFASDHPQQEDWIREEANVRKSKLTLNDVLKKENDIRRLGKEAEEEAELEEEEEDDTEQVEDVDDEDGENVDEDELDQEYDDDNQSGYGSDDDFSDGYNTDEDLAFADSDEEEEDDGLLLWTLTTTRLAEGNLTDATPVFRPSSLGALSDSSDYSRRVLRHKRSRQRSIPRAVTPELPDSTDFVCGTMDEDRPLEEAYMTRLAARKQEKLRIIPQDIDPSFPTSEPEDDDDDVGSHHSRDSGEPLWLHGELEELDDERSDRRRRKSPSPKGLRSPPPAKRYHSPPPKARGRSPRRVLNHSSPKRVKSPAPMQRAKSPAPSPSRANKATGFKNMAAPTGVTHTKSLPRAAYFPAHLKHGKRCRGNAAARNNGHVRGAIDIVKGLEQKRQRRKEKFHQKYCDRARKGQIPEKRAKAGEGAERMRELAGKMGQGNYVISI